MGTKLAYSDMVFYVDNQPFVVFWNTEVAMGRMVRGKQNVKEAAELALGNVTDVANLHGGDIGSQDLAPKGRAHRQEISAQGGGGRYHSEP